MIVDASNQISFVINLRHSRISCAQEQFAQLAQAQPIGGCELGALTSKGQLHSWGTRIDGPTLIVL
jgi:hypothetical protein